MTKKLVFTPQKGGDHPLARLIDHEETYGPHIIERFVKKINLLETIVDIGAGSGRDLLMVKKLHPSASTVAIEAGHEYAKNLFGIVDQVYISNIERDKLPFEDESVDLIIANQVLEHTKEIFWIFHEVTRSLRVGGHFLIGVPNIASLHNRLLLLIGEHPTQHKLRSAHVRPFSKLDTIKFVDECFPLGYKLIDFAGSQFYPFPKSIARALSKGFPTASFSIFFLFQKLTEYTDGFVKYPSNYQLETNFWIGSTNHDSQYK